jgi:hypothetical protein
MNQVAGNQMRLYDLPSKQLCRVINVELKVPAHTLTLFPQFPTPISLPAQKIFSDIYLTNLNKIFNK